jgi:hypothetical protein
MPKPDPIQSLMEMLGTPLTRENYVHLATMGKSKELSPEEEAELPARFQRFSPTHEDLERDKQAKQKPAKGVKGKKEQPAPAGAPVDWGGMIIPNTSGVTPELDTEHKTQPPKVGYADMDTGLAAGPGVDQDKMSMALPAKNEMEGPEPERHFLSPSGEMVPNEMPTREQ